MWKSSIIKYKRNMLGAEILNAVSRELGVRTDN
jgi:hypothetical protein